MKRLLASLSPRMWRSRARKRLAERLLISVEQRGAIVFDRRIVEEMGVSREVAVRVVCYLLLKERIHMLSDGRGRSVLMSVPEFVRHMENRSRGDEESEIHVRDGLKSIVVERFEEDEVPILIDSACVDGTDPEREITASCGDSEAVLFISPPLRMVESEMDWFTVADGTGVSEDGEPAKLPLDRQSLPERRREPWSAADDVRLDNE